MRTLRALASCSVVLVACNADPVHDDRVDALGKEAPGVPPGPLHRPGQPCLLCHDGRGPGNDEFSVAGTVYQFKDSDVPLSDAIVLLLDSRTCPPTKPDCNRFATATNCAGNFFVDSHDFAPVRPMWVSLVYGGIAVPMSSPMFRTGSCADCHHDPPSSDSVGHVYFAPTTIPFPPSGCP